jgi:hypothetical protein
MALQFSVSVRNARLDAIETVVGASPVLKIRSGSAPASTGDADTGDVLATINLPSDWMDAASGGSKSKSATAWEDASADLSGTAGHFRIYDNGETTVLMQGTVSMAGGGGDMIVDNTSIAAGQTVTVQTFTLTDGNA